MDRRLGRYVVLDELAAGGMGRVHIGKLTAGGGFSRVVAIKVLHARYAGDAHARSMFLDEARLVASIRHPNVVSTLDVIEDQGELFLIMDYVHGLPFWRIIRDVRGAGEQIPIPIVAAIMIDALEGLHAAHEGRSDTGSAMDIVHRDVSPQNIMVGSDGLARVVDFGVAHATDRLQRTIPGQIKGKVAYMAPEQATGLPIDRRADVYSAAIVLWEALAGSRLFHGPSLSAIVLKHLQELPPPPSSERPEIPPELDAIVLRGLEKRPIDRFSTAHEMAAAIEHAVGRASRSELGSWLSRTESAFFAERDDLLARLPRELPDTRRSNPELSLPESGLSGVTERDGPLARLGMTATQLDVPRAGDDDAIPVPPAVGRRGPTMALVSAAIVAFIVVGILATHSPGAQRAVALVPVPSSVVPAIPPIETATPLPVAEAMSSPTVATAATSPVPPRATSGGKPSAAPSALQHGAPPPPGRRAEDLCCTPDGTLQLRFHDCVNNCKN